MGKGKMDSIVNAYHECRAMRKRELLYQTLSVLTIAFSAVMLWKLMCLLTGSVSPIVVVLSGSMEPTFARGDILFLKHDSGSQLSVGDICVFEIPKREIPIVHRILEYHIDPNGNERILTKGDNNRANDRGLYSPGEPWLARDAVVGTGE
jgi:signal peptidase